MQVLGGDAKGGFQSFEVLVVLPQRALEFEGAFIELLRTLCLLLAAEYQAAHVLRFQREDAVDRQKDVIDLRRAIGRIQGDVMQAAVGVLIQLSVSEESDDQFADMALGPRRLDQRDQKYGWDKPDQHAQYLGNNRGEVHFSTFRRILRWLDSTEI